MKDRDKTMVYLDGCKYWYYLFILCIIKKFIKKIINPPKSVMKSCNKRQLTIKILLVGEAVIERMYSSYFNIQRESLHIRWSREPQLFVLKKLSADLIKRRILFLNKQLNTDCVTRCTRKEIRGWDGTERLMRRDHLQPRGQGLWLLIMRSRVRFPVLPWEFFLAGKDSRGDHGLGSQ